MRNTTMKKIAKLVARIKYNTARWNTLSGQEKMDAVVDIQLTQNAINKLQASLTK